MIQYSKQPIRRRLLFQGAADFFYLQNRLYPRSSSLELVGNRYELTHAERQLLHRGVFGQGEAIRRRAKRCEGASWQKMRLVVDGHNVQITVESAILGRVLLLANDGALRDIAEQSSQFRVTEFSESALDMIFRFLEEFRPQSVLFLFDAPMSHSGALADRYRQRLKTSGIPGGARAVPVPEREIPYEECVTASSDREILDASIHWLDLARLVIDAADLTIPLLDFSSFVESRPPDFYE
jgi:hypothetical protein